jgi:hypothetical protein
MRTSRLSRWLLSGALVAAGAVAGFGGQAVGSDGGDQTPTVETQTDDADVNAPTTSTGDGDAASTDAWEWQ